MTVRFKSEFWSNWYEEGEEVQALLVSPAFSGWSPGSQLEAQEPQGGFYDNVSNINMFVGLQISNETMEGKNYSHIHTKTITCVISGHNTSQKRIRNI